MNSPYKVVIWPADLGGYFDFPDGSEGGGLWFDRDDNGTLSLRDYDGVFSLPAGVIADLRSAGVVVGPEFEPEGAE